MNVDEGEKSNKEQALEQDKKENNKRFLPFDR